MPNWTALYILLFSLAIAFIYQPLSSNNVFNVPASKLAFVSTPQRILLLTAHPDDEALFFAPTIISLVAQAKAIAVEKKNNPIAIASQTPVPSALEIYSLCISTGNADGIGGVRTQELRRSLDILEINPENSWIIDHPHLQDNLTATWDPEIIADAIKHYVLDNKITSILTFDEGGVSKHPNHKSLPSGAKHLLENHHFTGPTPQLFTLISVSLVSKYTSVIAPVMAKLDLYGFRTLTWYERQIERILEAFEIIPTLDENSPTKKILMPVFVSGMPEYGKALAAMRAHKSQLVWFRWLNVMFSRYMWVNEWAEVKV